MNNILQRLVDDKKLSRYPNPDGMVLIDVECLERLADKLQAAESKLNEMNGDLKKIGALACTLDCFDEQESWARQKIFDIVKEHTGINASELMGIAIAQSNADKVEIDRAVQYDLGKKNGLEIGWQFGISDNELEFNQLRDHLKKHLDAHKSTAQ